MCTVLHVYSSTCVQFDSCTFLHMYISTWLQAEQQPAVVAIPMLLTNASDCPGLLLLHAIAVKSKADRQGHSREQVKPELKDLYSSRLLPDEPCKSPAGQCWLYEEET